MTNKWEKLKTFTSRLDAGNAPPINAETVETEPGRPLEERTARSNEVAFPHTFEARPAGVTEEQWDRIENASITFFHRLERGANATVMYTLTAKTMHPEDIHILNNVLASRGVHINGNSAEQAPDISSLGRSENQITRKLGTPDVMVGSTPAWYMPGDSVVFFDANKKAKDGVLLTIESGGIHRFDEGWYEYNPEIGLVKLDADEGFARHKALKQALHAEWDLKSNPRAERWRAETESAEKKAEHAADSKSEPPHAEPPDIETELPEVANEKWPEEWIRRADSGFDYLMRREKEGGTIRQIRRATPQDIENVRAAKRYGRGEAPKKKEPPHDAPPEPEVPPAAGRAEGKESGKRTLAEAVAMLSSNLFVRHMRYAEAWHLAAKDLSDGAKQKLRQQAIEHKFIPEGVLDSILGNGDSEEKDIDSEELDEDGISKALKNEIRKRGEPAGYQLDTPYWMAGENAIVWIGGTNKNSRTHLLKPGEAHEFIKAGGTKETLRWDPVLLFYDEDKISSAAPVPASPEAVVQREFSHRGRKISILSDGKALMHTDRNTKTELRNGATYDFSEWDAVSGRERNRQSRWDAAEQRFRDL